MTLLEKHLGAKVEETEPTNPRKKRRGNGDRRKGNWRVPPSKQCPPWDLHGDCWTHGYKVRMGHNSFTCEEG